MPDGIKLGGAYYELTADSAPLIQAMAKAEAASKKSAQAIAQATGIPEGAVTRYAATMIREQNAAAASAEKAAQRTAAANTKAAGSFGDLAKGALNFTAAAAGVTLGASAVGAAMTKIAEETQKANQAQFALQNTFKSTTVAYIQFAQTQADATKRTTSEVQQAIVAFGSLANRYALNSEQIKELTKRSADLAAVKGISTVAAAKRLESALRGEAEAAEYLGLTLNSEYLKKFADMTDLQRKNWESLDPLIKAQITYREVLKQTADQQGAAQKRTQDAAGAADNLKTAVDNLAVTFGKGLAPSVAAAANDFASLLTSMNEVAKTASSQDFKDFVNIMSRLGALGPAGAVAEAARIRAQREIEAALGPVYGPPQVGPDAGLPGSGAGPTQGQADALSRGRSDALIAAAEAKARRQAELQDQEEAAKKRAEAEIKAIDAERKAKTTWYDEERTRIEARRTYQLEDIEARKDAALAALAEEKQASKDSFDAAIRDAEREKQARLEVAGVVRDAQLAAIKERERLNELDRQAQDRQTSDQRQRADRIIADARSYEDRQREEAHTAELRRLEERHKKALDDLDAETKAAQAASEERIRNIDNQADRARKASDDAIRNIERQASKEDDRHRAAIQALDDERDARLAILQTQLDTLDAQEKAESSARRTADLQKRVADAQKAATLARGTGTPEEVAAARGDLTRAIKVGDPVSIANATERLKKLAGQGNEAILKADEDLAKAQDDLRQEGVDQARNAERDKLTAAQAAITDEIAARKAAEDDRNQQRKRELDADKQAEQDRLKSRLDTLEKKKTAEQDALKDDLAAIARRKDAEQESYTSGTQGVRDAYAEQSRLLALKRQEEDRAIDDRRVKEDRDRADRRSEEDRALRLQEEAVSQSYAEERRLTEEHYNGPNGIITQLKAASEASEREYSRRLAAARASFEEERKQAERVYRNPEKNGLLDLLDIARNAEIDALNDSKGRWEEWSRAVQEAVKAALDALKNSSAGGDIPAVRGAPSGSNTSSSTARTRSDTSGQVVQGDVVSWLNDAIDITGVSNDWLPALQRLVALESSGDPHIKNRQGSGATGLLQVKPATFASYRDKSLPDNILDPVANAVASINWIKAKYKKPSNIPGLLDGGKFDGYDSGHLFTEPTATYGLRTGQRALIAERRPELLVSGAATQQLLPALSMPSRDYASVGASLSAVGGGSYSSSNSSVVNFNGLTYEEAERKQRRQQHRDSLLRGVATLGRRK